MCHSVKRSFAYHEKDELTCSLPANLGWLMLVIGSAKLFVLQRFLVELNILLVELKTAIYLSGTAIYFPRPILVTVSSE